MFEFFAKKLGVDVSKIQVVNTAPPGLVGYALADRADAIQLWEPAYTLLKAKKPEIRMLDTDMSKTWKSFAGGERIPYLGVAAHTDWIEANQALIPKLYATYKEAGEYIAKTSGGSSRADRAEIDAGGPRRAGVVDQGQRPARHERGAGRRRRQADRRGLQGRRRRRLFQGDAVERHDLHEADEMTNSRTLRVLQAAAGMLVLAAGWQILSCLFPHYLFPPVPEIISRTIEVLITGSLLVDVLLTAARIFGGLFGAFILGGMLALVIGQSKTAENFIAPVLTFFQGIPALSWVVFAIIWFHGIEFRVLFIMVMTTLPAFTFQILDAFRSMSKDLFEMTMAFRPRRWTLFRFLIVPTIVPGILTAWKVNLGNAARVVVVAELVGATGGVGYQLLRQQQLFDMAGAMAWTLQLVLFVLIVQQTITAIETWALRYRAVSERAM